MISWLHVEWLEKSWGAHALWCRTRTIFQLTELIITANPPCFQYSCARGRATWRTELCTKRMRDANVRNHLKLDFRRLLGSSPLAQASFQDSGLWSSLLRFSGILVKESSSHTQIGLTFRGLIYIFLSTSLPDLFMWEFPSGCLQADESTLIERT